MLSQKPRFRTMQIFLQRCAARLDQHHAGAEARPVVRAQDALSLSLDEAEGNACSLEARADGGDGERADVAAGEAAARSGRGGERVPEPANGSTTSEPTSLVARTMRSSSLSGFCVG